MNESSTKIEITIESILKEKFHLSSLYPFQQLVVTRILEQEGLFGNKKVHKGTTSQLIILPTGSGKSVCFTLPAMLINSVTLIVYPLLSLLSDQKRRIESLGEKPVIIKGGQSHADRTKIFNTIRNGEAKILLTTAETLQNQSVLAILSSIPIGLMVIDEAHVIAQWGLTFRPSYLSLRKSIESLTPHQILAFTATADENIIQVINNVLSPSKRMHQIKGNIDRENIYYKVIPTLSKIHTLTHIASTRSLRPLIIFFSNRDLSEKVACELSKRLKEPICRYYHAKLDKTERSHTERWFFESDNAILCATSAYGMGVDKKNIRCVVHYSLSNDVSSFLQESGRGGRDGKLTLSITLYERDEYVRGKQDYASIFFDSSACRRKRLLDLMESPIEHCSGCDVCDRSYISTPLGEKEILRTISLAPFRFSRVSLSHHLVATHYKNIFPYGSNYGLLKDWTVDDVMNSISTLIRAKEICIRWSDKLYIPINKLRLVKRIQNLLYHLRNSHSLHFHLTQYDRCKDNSSSKNHIQ